MRKGACAVVAVAALFGAGPNAHAGDDLLVYECDHDICTIDPDVPGSRVNLTQTGAGQEQIPAWSPDGESIAYVGYYEDAPWGEQRDLFTFDLANPTISTNLSETEDLWAPFTYRPAWSPDGTRVTYGEEVLGQYTKTFAVAANGLSEPVPVGSLTGTSSEAYPFWVTNLDVGFSRAFATFRATVGAPGTGTWIQGSQGVHGSLSPDGTRVATVAGSNPNGKVVVARTDGSGAVDLPFKADTFADVEWTNDASRVIFVDETDRKIRVAPADGTPGGSVLIPGDYLAPYNYEVSPDGTRIAFNAYSAGNGHIRIWTAKLDGSANATSITSPTGNDYAPDWRPRDVPTDPGNPGTSTTPGTPSTPGAPGGGSAPSTTPPVVAPAPNRTPRRFAFASFKAPIYHPQYMTLAWVSCTYPTPAAIAAGCTFGAEAHASGWADAGMSAKKKRKAVFARASMKVPYGKRGDLKLKYTKAGRKMLKPGRKLRVQVTITMRRPGAAPQITKKTVALKVPRKRRR